MNQNLSSRGDIILEKLRREMAAKGLDALIALTPENAYYSCGSMSYFLYNFRTAGLMMTVIPRSESLEPAAIVCDFESQTIEESTWIRDVRKYPMWIFVDETHGKGFSQTAGAGKEKRSDFSLGSSFGLLAEILKEMGLTRAVLGVETGYVQRAVWEGLTGAAPEAKWTDSENVWMECRMRKTAWEIENLRSAAHATEKAILECVKTIREGTPLEEITRGFAAMLQRDASVHGSRFCMVRVGDSFAPSILPRADRARPGDLIEFDCGADCRGYTADISRTFIMGRPNDVPKKTHGLLLGAFEKSLKAMTPGRKVSDIFHIGQNHVRAHGMPHYNRGHLGHGVGLSLAVEESPILSPKDAHILEPGMVISLELPYYGYGVGAISIEDMVLITEDGHETLSGLSRELVEL